MYGFAAVFRPLRQHFFSFTKEVGGRSRGLRHEFREELPSVAGRRRMGAAFRVRTLLIVGVGSVWVRGWFSGQYRGHAVLQVGGESLSCARTPPRGNLGSTKIHQQSVKHGRR